MSSNLQFMNGVEPFKMKVEYKQDSFLSHIFNFQDLPSEVDFPDMIFFSFIWKIKIIEHY